MRVFCALIFLFGSLVLAAAQNSLKNLEKVRISGSDYIRVKEWCDAVDLDLRWVKKDEDLRATNRNWYFFISVNSRKAQINKMNLLLSLPVISRKGVPFISVVDLHTTIHPVLFPSKNPVGKNVKTICLDPGHGGRDPGNMEKKSQEKKYTLLLAEETARLLRQAGFHVVFTRSNDRFVDLSERAVIANRNNADLLVSLHYNSAASAEVNGVEVYCLSPAGTESSNSGGGASKVGAFPGNAQNERNMLLAFLMQKSLLKNLTVADRGIKRARFEVLREAKMPAVLLECGFMSNPAEARRIYDSAHRKRMALAIADGILAYKRTVENEAASKR